MMMGQSVAGLWPSDDHGSKPHSPPTAPGAKPKADARTDTKGGKELDEKSRENDHSVDCW